MINAAAIRIILIGSIICTGTVGFAQSLAQTAEQQSDLSQVLKTSGTLFVREIHNLPAITTIGDSKNIECDVVIVRILSPLSTLSKEDTTTVGLRLTIEEEYSERSAYIDVDEAEGLLASLTIMSNEGMDILTSPLVEGIEHGRRSSEIHYTTKEEVSLGAFDYRGNLRFALKISSLADWVLLHPHGAAQLVTNLHLAINIGRGIANGT